MRIAFAKVILLSVLILQLSMGAVNAAGLVWPPPPPMGVYVLLSPNPVSVGSPVTCTATLSLSITPNATGTVTWTTNSSTGSFSQSVCTLSSGNCSTTYVDTSPGSVIIKASYSGDSNHGPSTESIILTVSPAYAVGGYSILTNAFTTNALSYYLIFVAILVAGLVATKRKTQKNRNSSISLFWAID